MKKLKKILIFAAVAIVFACLLCLSLSAQSYSGTCGAESDGSNLTWTLDSEGLLKIEGKGAMAEYISSRDVPWNSYRRNIKTVEIAEGVTSIGRYAFDDCSSLTSITIPEGVTSIGDYAFYCCSSLTSITFIENSKLTSIGDHAFYYCPSLTSITIPEGVTSIGSFAFYRCSSFTSITIPASVTSIGDWAFSSCSSLTSITIPASVTSIGYGAFSGCSSLESITVEEGNTVYHSSGNCLIETATKVLIAGCKNSIIPDNGSVTNIGYYAFEDCSSLTSITIPEGVTSIGGYAFSGCSSLESITVEEGNTVYHSSGNCLIKTEAKVLIAGCKNSMIPDDGSVTSIGGSAFYDCDSLTSITIPEGVTSIGWAAFRGCSSLTSITIPDSVTSIGDS
ncbi:MAG: leucine-rich repeat domain-containing protein, partial [Eubacteriales bacterium]